MMEEMINMADNINTFFLLLVILQVKHFICDYPLQTPYMLQKASVDKWIKPLLAHSIVHSVGTFLVFAYFNVAYALCFAMADLILHFIVDRIKASPNIGNRWGIEKPQFWWALGLDQMSHHLINFAFVYILLITSI